MDAQVVIEGYVVFLVSRTFMVLLTCAGCVAHGKVVDGKPEDIAGEVAEADSGQPIAGARVTFCKYQKERMDAIEDPFGPCPGELAWASTDQAGRFRLARGPAFDRDGDTVMVTAAGYLPWVARTSTLSTERKIALWRAPTVEVKVINAHGKPIGHAGAGWLVETKDGLKGRYQACCTSADGILPFTLDGVLAGSVVLFALAGEPPASFGSTTIRTAIGKHYPSTIIVDKPLHRIEGRVADASGAPLAALVSVLPASRTTFSALDRILLAAQGEETDLHGSFARHLTAPVRALLELRTWVGLRRGTPHVATETLSTTETQFAEHPREVVLRAPAAPAVRCTMLGPDGTHVPLSSLGISFAPHRSDGHSGRCFWPGGPPSADVQDRSTSHEVRFLWPPAAEQLLVLGRGVARANAQTYSYEGELMLEHADEPCQIRGR